MGLFDKSKSKTSVNQTYNTTTTTALTDNSGNQGIQAGGAVRLDTRSSSTKTTNNISTDQGAVKIAGNIATAGITSAQASAAGALGFGKSALDTVAKANGDSLKLISGLITGAFDNSKTVVRDALDANAKATNDSISGFAALAKQTSASDGDKVGKVAMYAFVAIAAVFVLPAIFKGGAKVGFS